MSSDGKSCDSKCKYPDILTGISAPHQAAQQQDVISVQLIHINNLETKKLSVWPLVHNTSPPMD